VTTIREADLSDLEVIVALGLRFASESVYADRLMVTEAGVRTTAQWLLGGSGTIFLSDKDGAVVGMIGVSILPHFLSGMLYGAEVFWWCNPEHRGHGLRLLRRAEQWAQERGARFFQATAPTDDVSAIYERLSYRKIETGYQKDFSHAQ
jgi:GNAT superfamily N-acetyltransferase